MVNIEETERKVTVKVTEKLTIDEAIYLRSKLAKNIKENQPKEFFIDLQRVHDLDVAGLGTIVSLDRKINKVKGKLIIQNPSKEVQELIVMTRLTRALHVQQ